MYDTDKTLLAIAEAERVASAFERPFSKLLGKEGFTPDLVDRFANEFMVARTFRWLSKEELKNYTTESQKDAAKKDEKQRVEHGFAAFFASLPTAYSGDLIDHFNVLCERVTEHPTAGKIWGNQEFVSALTKFQMVQSNWDFPPFDKHAANIAGIKRNLKAKDRAIAYYKALDKAEFAEATQQIATILKNKIALNPSRVIDKHMILKGFKIKPFVEAYFGCQPPETKTLWKDAAKEIAPIIGKFYDRLG